jgi:fructose-1,6-bisphosphatase/sedoheptulose 1,7-bisphosphatase-like protein
MTRGQVARRLGKSLATVRRLEGVLLHPQRDARGVHHFDANEVDALADRIADGDVTVWQQLRGNDGDVEFPLGHGACPRCSEAEAKTEALQNELHEQQNRFERRLAEVQRQHEEQAMTYRAERLEFERELRSFVAALDGL